MAKHFNQLTPPEAERLAVLAEECAEVIQAIGKILRHGYASRWEGESNKDALEKELGHVLHAYDRLVKAGDLSDQTVKISQLFKARDIEPFLHHQEADNG